jgi:hypothetical protein
MAKKEVNLEPEIQPEVQSEPGEPEIQPEKPKKENKPKAVTFSHRFLFATYNLNGARVDFVNGTFTTTDQQIIDALRKHPDLGGELAELGVK